MDFAYAALRRFPDVEAPNLQAWDATDQLFVARALAAGAAGDEIAVIGDEYGAITLALVDAGYRGIRVHQDLATGRRALTRNAEALGYADAGPAQIPDDHAPARRVDSRRADERAERLGYGTPESAFVECELAPELLRGARLVLLQLPKSLAELEEIADAVARWAAPDATLIAGGRVKHMTLAQNEVLGRSFESVQPQLAERKSRLIVASSPRAVAAEAPYPAASNIDVPGLDRSLTLIAHGGAFAGAKLDIGTRVLLEVLAERLRLAALAQPVSSRSARSTTRKSEPLREQDSPREAESSREQDERPLRVVERRSEAPETKRGERAEGESKPSGEPQTVVDLGCGTGVLAATYALTHPDARVIATDRSAAAVASARATMRANGIDAEVTHDDAGSEIPDRSADLILLNPPFHLGASIHTGAATRLFDAAARMLKPGGELLTVYNTHLAYKQELMRKIGETEQLHRTSKFTVTRSIRR